MAAVIFFVVVGGLLLWRYATPSGQAVGQAARRSKVATRAAQNVSMPLSTAGVQTAAGLACPKCGGTQFKAHRKFGTKLAFGVGSLLGEARHVRCVTCGTDYRRG